MNFYRYHLIIGGRHCISNIGTPVWHHRRECMVKLSLQVVSISACGQVLRLDSTDYIVFFFYYFLNGLVLLQGFFHILGIPPFTQITRKTYIHSHTAPCVILLNHL